ATLLETENSELTGSGLLGLSTSMIVVNDSWLLLSPARPMSMICAGAVTANAVLRLPSGFLADPPEPAPSVAVPFWIEAESGPNEVLKFRPVAVMPTLTRMPVPVWFVGSGALVSTKKRSWSFSTSRFLAVTVGGWATSPFGAVPLLAVNAAFWMVSAVTFA